jgi:predicted nucleic-acid-binding Zn-ribbon protein
MALACPKCGSRNLRPSHFQNAEERRKALFFISPLRCKDCKTRFTSRTIFPEDLLYARCPKCDRMDLNSWNERRPTTSRWTLFKLQLGAYKTRCEYCRYDFASFRKRKETFTFSRWRKRNPDRVAEKPAKQAASEDARKLPDNRRAAS